MLLLAGMMILIDFFFNPIPHMKTSFSLILLCLIHIPYTLLGQSGDDSNYGLLPDRPIHNVIFMIGDGMGISHITAARIQKQGVKGRLHLERMPVTRWLTTHTANELVTKSDAGGTALATGFKTRNGMIGMTPDSVPVLSILEAARDIGKSTGIITTSYLTDATPAAFATHVPRRSDQQTIARQLIESRVDILFGGGREQFLPTSSPNGVRTDGLNLIDTAKVRGYEYVQTEEALRNSNSSRLLGLFGNGVLFTTDTVPSLQFLTQHSIALLSRSRSGFFLMVEEEGIDEASHDNDFDLMTRCLLAFDEAVERALAFAQKDSNTLVIVTADHETGGLQIVSGSTDGSKMGHKWLQKAHTGHPVPFFAYGPYAERFMGIKDNTEVSRILSLLLGIQDFPRRLKK